MSSAAATVAAQDNIGVCEPVERIRNMKDTARHSDYKKWVDRCQVSGSKGQCGHRPEWPVGDGGRCAMSSAAATVAAQDVNPTVAPVVRADPHALTPKQKERRAVCAGHIASMNRSNPREVSANAHCNENGVMMCWQPGKKCRSKSRCRYGKC